MEIISEGVYWLQQNAVLVGGGLLIITAAFISEEKVRLVPGWRGVMKKRERREYVRDMVTSEFVSVVEDKVSDGTFTRSEASEIYRELKSIFPVRGLFPSPHLLKEAIQRRLNTKIHEAVNLPDRTPVKKRRHMFEA